jgi:hypothetical protein
LHSERDVRTPAATTPACAFKGPLPTFATIFQRPLDVEKPAVAERVTG